MRNYIKIILTLWTLGLLACSQSSKPLFDKVPIDPSEVDFIIIKRLKDSSNTTDQDSLRLTSLQTKTIIDKWNSSKETGLCKYWPKYQMTIHLKNEEKRTFRIRGQ